MSVETVNIGGIPLVYEKEGSGPPLVFLHGGNQSAIYWEAVVPYLMGDNTCYILEQRGHGRSGRSDDARYSLADYSEECASFLREVVGPAVLVGHSQGGHAAFGAARSAPDLVIGIYSEDCVPWAGAISVCRKTPLFRAFPLLGEVARKALAEKYSTAQLAFATGQLAFGNGRWMHQQSPEMLIHAARSGFNTDPAWFDLAAAIDGFVWSDQEAVEITRSIKCPVHLAYGNPALGGLIRDESLQSLADAGLVHTSTYFGDVGHVISPVAPREFITDLRAFLDRLPRETPQSPASARPPLAAEAP